MKVWHFAFAWWVLFCLPAGVGVLDRSCIIHNIKFAAIQTVIREEIVK